MKKCSVQHDSHDLTYWPYAQLMSSYIPGSRFGAPAQKVRRMAAGGEI